MFSFFRKRDEDSVENPVTTPVDGPAPPATEEAAVPSEADGSSSEGPTSTASSDSSFNYDALFSPPPSESTPKEDVGESDEAKTAELTPPIVEALRTVYDPEIPVNIYDLGLIYDIAVDANARAKITMTLTSPACPSAQQLPVEVEWKVKDVPGVDKASVNVVWEPPWSKERMSEEARLALGMF